MYVCYWWRSVTYVFRPATLESRHTAHWEGDSLSQWHTFLAYIHDSNLPFQRTLSMVLLERINIFVVDACGLLTEVEYGGRVPG